MIELIKRDDAIKTMMRFRGYDGFDEDMMYRIKYALTHRTPVAAEIPEKHGPLVDWWYVQKELDQLFSVVVTDEHTGIQHREYPIILEDNPIRIPIIIPATERKEQTMTKAEKRDYVDHIKLEACTPKSRLMELAEKLGEVGAIREQKSLESIIWKLELWQNK